MLIEYTVGYVKSQAISALDTMRAADAEYTAGRLKKRKEEKERCDKVVAARKELKKKSIHERAVELVAENEKKRNRQFSLFTTDELTMEAALAEAKRTVIFLGGASIQDYSYMNIRVDYPNKAGIAIVTALVNAVDNLPDDQNIMLTTQEINFLQIGNEDG